MLNKGEYITTIFAGSEKNGKQSHRQKDARGNNEKISINQSINLLVELIYELIYGEYHRRLVIFTQECTI